MNLERKSDMLAWQWSETAGEDVRDFELMLSFEPGKWALPIALEYGGYEGHSDGYVCVCRYWTFRLFCGSIHFSRDRTSPTVSEAQK